ncbi:MAG: efflux RND transporter permease subunit [Elusimicrobiota bacterium]
MNLTDLALRRPMAVIVAVCTAALSAVLALTNMQKDIFPDLKSPVIYVAQPYGGMDPAQMEGYLTYYYEYHFLFVSGIEHVESQNIQGAALIKLQFHPGTDMAQAMAETVAYVDRARAYMPQGTLPPFILRFDAGTIPIGDLVFTSKTRSLGDMQDLALNVIRPLFATLPGVSAPAPFGASQRTIVVRVDPKKMREFNLSPSDVAQAISDANKVVPSGNIHIGSLYPVVRLNSVVRDIKKLENVPIRTGTEETVFLRNVGTVEDSTDIQAGYALVNGRRAIYMPVTKRSDASTLAVVNLVRKNLEHFRNMLPPDVNISYEFDQSIFVRSAIRSLVAESVAGAALSGLMVLLFLGDWLSAVTVVVTIPFALFMALTALWLSGQTINIMTLGGLALAVGILVDEATVTVENIDTHLALGQTAARAALDATKETFMPALLAALAVIAVFIPSFFMTGVLRALFIPLTLAVGFSMAASFILSTAFVPILAIWFLPKRSGIGSVAPRSAFGGFRKRYAHILKKMMLKRRWILALCVAGAAVFILIFSGKIGLSIFPRVDTGQFRLRLRTPTGTSIENTEAATLKALGIISREAGPSNIESSIGYVGVQPTSFPVNLIYLWTSGPHEAIMEIALKRSSGIKMEDLKERLRTLFAKEIPELEVSFEESGIVNKVMSGASPTPIEIAIYGGSYSADRAYAELVRNALARSPVLRDVQITQAFNYPEIKIDVDRQRAGYMGLTIAKIGQAVVPATSSSRFILRNYWAEPGSGITHQIQVEIPREGMDSIGKIRDILVAVNGGAVPLRRFANVVSTTAIGEYDRYDMQRVVTVTANIHGEDLGHAARHVRKILDSIKLEKPRGITVDIRGQVKPMEKMFKGLGVGLAMAVLVIFLLLTANFESVALSLIVLSTIPAVIVGIEISLLLTGTTLNIESFMGAIMAVGIAVANAVLLVSFAERHKRSGYGSDEAALEGAKTRLRPILMTSIAMVAGMLPMASGFGESGQQTAPLGRAVIGGLAAATVATLFVLPLVYAVFRGSAPHRSPSLHPDDPDSDHFHFSGRQ